MTKKLNNQEKAFVEHYLICLKPYDAAIKAGYAESTAKSQAFTWTSDNKCPDNKKHVLAAITKGKEKRSERTGIDADYVLRELAEVWEADIADIIDDRGSLLPIKQWPLIWRKICRGISVKEIFETEGRKKVKVGEISTPTFVDPAKMLELIGKHVKVSAFAENLKLQAPPETAFRLEVVPIANTPDD